MRSLPTPQESGHNGQLGRRAVRLLTALVLGFSGLIVVVPTVAEAAGSIVLAKTSSATVLLGGEVSYHLAVSNPVASNTEQYNLSFSDTLPTGVTYVSGSTSPQSFGEPRVVTIVDDATVIPNTTHQVLVWENVSDVTIGATRSLDFRARVDPDEYPIGATVDNEASAFTSSDVREVPAFDDNGQPLPGSEVVSSTDSTTTGVSAVRITKSEGSPEGELLRGVNDHQTVYSLTVTNNTVDSTGSLVVIDFLPAGLEYLGCGGPFNSDLPEYSGAGDVVADVADCTDATAVDTVLDPVGYPAGVYTRITWVISDLGAGEAFTLRYGAGIPQRENTMVWDGGDNGDQTANLNNNNGAPTAETGAELSLRNYAEVGGLFQGQPVADRTQHTVTAEDLRLLKSVTPSTFTQGGIATYTLTIDTSEYADLSDLVVTDEMPAGLCPLRTSDPSYTPPAAECEIDQGAAPTDASITGVVVNADGSFTLTITPDVTDLQASGQLVITYQALMRTQYDQLATGPTSAADSFTNTAEVTGISAPPTEVDAPVTDPVEIRDQSSATIASGGPQLTKLRMRNTSPMTCSDTPGDYATSFPGEAPFTEGDRVCFLLQVQFPTGVDTRNAQLTDYLPTNLVYESSHEVSPAGMVQPVDPGTPTTYASWLLGSGSPRVVPKGTLVQIALSAIVIKPAPLTAGTPKALDAMNLAKFRYTNTQGQTESLRDAVALPLGPPPPIGITKGVQSVNSTVIDNGSTPGNVDGSTVRGGDQVTFRIDLQNLARPGEINAVAMGAPDVWDVLPPGVDCAAISAISDAGACFNAGDALRPNVSGNSTASVVRWQLPTSYVLAPQAYGKLTYTLAIPAGVSVSARFDNTAAVASFRSATNLGTGTGAVHNPVNNIDAGVPASVIDVPEARDTSYVIVPDTVMTKANVTDITEAGNSPTQAVVGETLTYTVSGRLPARTSVYNGRLSDPLPVGVDFVGPATALYSPTGVAPAATPLPAGVSIDPATGTLSFGNAYTNATDTDQLFEVKIPSRISTDATNTHGTIRTNTATFTSDTAATGGSPITPRTATSDVTVVAPLPSLTKTASPTSATGGDIVTYTVRANNAAGRPPLHDTWVVDCLPDALTFTAFSTIPAGTTAGAPVPGDGANGCAAGFTRIAWNIVNLAGNGTNVSLVYTAVLNTVPAGGDIYQNTANLKGSTLNDGKTDPLGPDNPLERVLTATASATVSVGGASTTKSSAQSTLTIGQVGSFTIRVTLPKNTAFYDSAVTDTLPAGMSYVAGSSTITCVNADLTACTVPGTALTPTSTAIGWLIGDVAPSTQVRTVTITYTARMNDIGGNAAGTNRVNNTRYLWNKVNGTDPTSVGASWAANSNNASSTVRVVEPGLTIAKSVNDSTVEPGQTFTYTLTVANNGRTVANLSAAYNIAITDAVPVGVVVNPATISPTGTLTGTDASGSGGTITWSLAGSLAPSGSTTLGYQATLAPSTTLGSTGRTNTASVAHYESLASGGRTNYPVTSATATVTPQFPQVVPSKAAAPGPAYLGTPKTWTVTLTNTGGATAHDVDAVDTLPQNWTYDAGSAAVVIAGVAAGQVEPALGTDGSGKQVLTWTNLGDIPAGVNNDLVVTFTATPRDPDAATTPGVGAAVPHTNGVAIVARDATGATGNLSGPYVSGPATASTHIDSADVQLTKTSGTAIAGQNLTYSLVVKNNGPDTAVGPFPVVDTLPAGIGSVTASGSGWNCSVSTTTVACARSNPADTLASGSSFATITVIGAIPADTAAGAVLTNTASVASTTHDPNLPNNTDEITDTVARSVDLGIAKTTTGAITAGQDATYTLDVTNHGPSDSTGPIVVTDTLPAGTAFVSADGTDWVCSEASGTLTCTRADGLDFGEAAPQITVVIDVPADRTTNLVNTASVDGPEPDPKPSNDTSTVNDPVLTAADLELTKVHQGTFIPGSTGTYEITVGNNGPSEASAPVRVTDQLAPELTFETDDSSDWACSADAGNLLTCTLTGSLAVGATDAFQITVRIDPAHTGDVTNSATISSPTDDPHPGNNTDGDNTGVSVRADLGIVKTHTGDATAGEDLAFNLAVTNHGESDSPGPITVSDTLPDGMTYSSFSGAGWSCSASGQVVTCIRASGLASGNSTAITLNVAVAADAGPDLLINRASVSGPAVDPKLSNNSDLDIVEVNDRANVSITKSASPSNAVAGGPVTYTLTVTNDGPSDADNVQVSDALPPGMEYVGVDGGPVFTCADANPVDCQVATMAAGTSTQIQVHARVGSAVAENTDITNTASVSTSTPGDVLTDNTDTATINVTTVADLSIVKTHPAGGVPAGQSVTFDLAVHNDGPSDAAPDVVVTDTLPDGMTYLSSTGPWTCTAAGQDVTCILDGGTGVPAGNDAPALTVTAQIDSDLDPDSLVDGILTNTAEVTSGTTDPNPGNNFTTDPVVPTFSADLSIVKSHSAPVRVGDPIDFTLAVANAGPSTARDVTVSDDLPAGLDFVSASGTGWTCTNSGQAVTCDLDQPLPAGATADDITVTATVLASAYPGVSNTAVVDSGTPDPVLPNNTSTDPVTVPPQVDLGITKTHEPEPMQVGDQATYTMNVTNAGQTDDPGPVVVRDSLPTGLSYVSASGDGWTCAAAGQDVTCDRAAGLATGGLSVITLVVLVEPEAYPAVVNTATVASTAEDPNPDNNTATDPAVVLPLFDLTLDKELESISGSRADWTITVTNNGPNVAPPPTTVIDDLPSELSYLGFEGTGWTCVPVGQLVTCVYDQELAVGEDVSFVLHTAIDPGTTGTIVNTASIEGGVVDSAQGKVPSGELSSTGGIALGTGLLGLMLVGAGLLLVRRKRRA